MLSAVCADLAIAVAQQTVAIQAQTAALFDQNKNFKQAIDQQAADNKAALDQQAQQNQAVVGLIQSGFEAVPQQVGCLAHTGVLQCRSSVGSLRMGTTL